MAELTKNNIRIRSPSINKIVSEDKYNPEDITAAEKAYIERHAPKPRVPRTDLKCGDLVVFLEGGYMGKKAVFLKQLENCMALVSGVSSLNGVPLVKIDERYLLKLDVSVEVSGLNDSSLEGEAVESRIGEAERMIQESNSDAEEAVLGALSKVKFMKRYLSEPFVVDRTKEFYSQRY